MNTNPNTMSEIVSKHSVDSELARLYEHEGKSNLMIQLLEEDVASLTAQRDELMEALERVCELVGMAPWIGDPPMHALFLDEMDKARKSLAKYKK